MRGTMITIRPDGSTDLLEFARAPSLEEITKAVGGDFELVPGFDSIIYHGVVMTCRALCDEHGKIEGRPINRLATIEWQLALHRSGHDGLLKDDDLRDWLVGSVAVLFGDAEFMRAL